VAIVDASDLLAHAVRHTYVLCSFDATSLDLAEAIAVAADAENAPVMFTVYEGAHLAHLLPAVEACATRIRSPAAVRAVVSSAEAAAAALRLGANCLTATADAASVATTAEACGAYVERAIRAVGDEPSSDECARLCNNGVPAIHHDGLLPRRAAEFLRPGREGSYEDTLRQLRQSIAATVSACLRRSGSAGHAPAAAACRAWVPVEHTILFNASAEEAEVRRMAARGTRVLANVPGVRRVFAGRAVTDGAKYRYCWIIRFASERVIDSYRAHPDHVAFADGEFRPRASDRISIDYKEFG